MYPCFPASTGTTQIAQRLELLWW